MRRAVLFGMVVAAACIFGTALGLSQQSGSTNFMGGPGGREFSDPEPSAGARVTEVRIRSSDAIDAVQMVYALAVGSGFMGDQHGGSGGRFSVFSLDPDEYITGISGRYGDTIDSLRIQTNKRASQLYGGGGGNRDYRLEVPRDTEAVGFVGRSGNLVDAIGLIYAPIQRRRGLFGQTIDAIGLTYTRIAFRR